MTSSEYTPGLRVGAASVAITPPVGIAMQGYELRYAEAVTDPLLASALAVGGDRLEWLLLSVDIIGVDCSFTGRVRKTLARSFSLRPSAITIACSHTHSGPATLPYLGAVLSDKTYLAFLERKLTLAAETAAKDLQDVHWRFGTTSLSQNVNRRVTKGGRIELGVDPEGPVDSRLRVIRIDRANGSFHSSPLALIVHYACHPTTSAGIPHISADWPGAMRSTLQRIYRKDDVAPVVCFLQGCTGDVTHRIGRDRDAWPEHFGQHTSLQCEILGRLTAAAAQQASERSVEFPAETIQTVAQPLKLPFRDCRGLEKSEIQVVRIGPSLRNLAQARNAVWFVTLPGEPFTNYGIELGRQFHRRLGTREDGVLVCGYTNDNVGYLCTPRALREGGYEAAVAHNMYHRPSPFSADTEAIVLDRSLNAALTFVQKTGTRWAPFYLRSRV